MIEGEAFVGAAVRVACVHGTIGGATLGRRVRVELFPTVSDLIAGKPTTVAVVGRAVLARRTGLVFPRGVFDPSLEERIRRAGQPLERFAFVRDGINPGPRWFRDRIVAEAREAGGGSRCFPCLEGRDITRYVLKPPRLVVRCDPALVSKRARAAGASFRQDWIFEGEKLVSRQTAARLTLARAPAGVRALNSVHLIVPRKDSPVDVLYLLAVLNSSVLGWYHAAVSGETRDVFPQVHVSTLRELPVPDPWATALQVGRDPAKRLARHDLLVRLARKLEAGENRAENDLKVDRAVAELFGLGPRDLVKIKKCLEALARPGERA